jgi:hypothetical protein
MLSSPSLSCARASSEEQTDGEPRPPLCRDCQQIDFQPLLDIDIAHLQKQPDGIALADLGTRCKVLEHENACPLCQLFHESRVKRKKSPRTYELRIYSYLRTAEKITFKSCTKQQLQRDFACLGVVPTGSAGAVFSVRADHGARILFSAKGSDNDSQIFEPKLLGPTADLENAKQWIDYCISRHGKKCLKLDGEITGMRLLDCETFNVVSAPQNPSYVALSYVWGQPPFYCDPPLDNPNGSGSLDPNITRTIRDAAVAVKALGYRYLWVDKLCIDQNDDKKKMIQINQMDLIYGGSDVTIISAYGEDCHYGLPGIHQTLRPGQRVVQLESMTIFSTPVTSAEDYIRCSKWAGRGWTLQEAVLATRRLVFTDTRIYFECDVLCCSEELAPNLDPMCDFENEIQFWFRPPGLFCAPMYESGNLSWYKELVNAFTERTLGFETDRSRAFLGIVRSFAQRGVENFWGIPFDSGCVDNSVLWNTEFTSNLAWSLSEMPDFGSDSAADLSLELPGESIPSWSWMRWRGSIRFYGSDVPSYSVVEYRFSDNVDSPDYSIQDYLRQKVSLASVASSRGPPRVLHLSVECVKPSAVSVSSYGRVQIGTIEVYHSINRGYVYEDLPKYFRRGKFRFLIFQHFMGGLMFDSKLDIKPRYGRCLIVEDFGDHVVRIGTCEVPGSISGENREKKRLKMI